jgi:hypothetical protein
MNPTEYSGLGPLTLAEVAGAARLRSTYAPRNLHIGSHRASRHERYSTWELGLKTLLRLSTT